MNDRYENLEDVELFELREPDVYSVDSYLEPRVRHVDALFEEVDETPQVYPIEETLSTITMDGEFSPRDRVMMGVSGNFRDYTVGLDRSDFKSYHGEYLQPNTFEDIMLKIDQEEVDARPTDIETRNIRFEIPVGQPTVEKDALPDDGVEVRFNDNIPTL
ncbi:hypothetical protein [Candidatus Nanohalovita haloferacivicina]|uniref:hypothetical protein n=1 Tax=Candidatus Nanohalovita haloferacivicina TaxID=2978046 RepID=UPI00325FAF96